MAEPIHEGVNSNNRAKVLWVPAIENIDAPTVAELTASGVVPITYSLTADGWQHDSTSEPFWSARYSKPRAVQREGDVDTNLTVVYVANGTDDDEARLALAEGNEGFIAHIPFYDNDAEIEEGQLAEVFAVTGGRQVVLPATENTEWSIQQRMLIRDTTKTGLVEIVAA